MTAGAVLCGGASRRMGTDKALLEIDGRPMAETVACALAAAGCDPVVFVGGDGVALATTGRPVVPDVWPGEGPLGGVLTALRHAGGDDIVVAACDLPALGEATVRALLAARTDDAMSVVAAVAGRRALVGWWSAGAAPILQRAWNEGERSMQHAYESPGLVVVAVEVAWAVVRNVNRPGDVPPDRI